MTRVSDRLPSPLYTAEQSRALDARIIRDHGVPGIQLMLRASRALFATLESLWPAERELQLFCGKGNNAGDAYLLAALARERGYTVCVWQVGDAPNAGDALLAVERARQAGVEVQTWSGEIPASGVVVDGLLGTGLKGEVRPAFAEAIAVINHSGLPVLAVDIPSGLSADTGCRLGSAVRADATATFIGLKRGLFTADAAEHGGRLFFSDLGAPDAVYAEERANSRRLLLAREMAALPPRARTAHKGHFGHALVVGGDYGMAGAAVLAASAAARAGAGLISCGTRPEHLAALLAQRPEVMVRGVEASADLAPLLDAATAVALGPGLGQEAWGRMLLGQVLATALPKVIDADALNLIAEMDDWQAADEVVMTPHPGEAARLLNCSTADIQRDRFAAAAALHRQFRATVVLKGAGTVVADHRGLDISQYGNPGMASGGMGDVLSGIIAALLAQGLAAPEAARLAVCAHSVAADRAAKAGERGLLAGDVVDELRAVLNP